MVYPKLIFHMTRYMPQKIMSIDPPSMKVYFPGLLDEDARLPICFRFLRSEGRRRFDNWGGETMLRLLFVGWRCKASNLLLISTVGGETIWWQYVFVCEWGGETMLRLLFVGRRCKASNLLLISTVGGETIWWQYVSVCECSHLRPKNAVLRTNS